MPRVRPPIDAKRAGSLRKSISHFVHAGNVVERHRDVLRIDRPRLFQTEHAPRHDAIEREAEPGKDQHAEHERRIRAVARRLRLADIESHATLDQAGHEGRIERDVSLRSHGRDTGAVDALELNGISFRHDRLHAVGLHVLEI
jgi:hypothetical protein